LRDCGSNDPTNSVKALRSVPNLFTVYTPTNTRTTLASAGISCRRVPVCLSACTSVRPSVCHKSVFHTETAKGRITQTTVHDSPGTLVFRCRKLQQNSNGVTPNGGAKCRWGRLNADGVAQNWRLSTRSVVNLARSQFITLSVHITCLQHVHPDAARRAGLSLTADPCYGRPME